MQQQDLLNRLTEDEIEQLWVVYHDYNGRACAKTVPKQRFAAVIENGIVFARANLDFTLEDHMAEGSIFTADTGDFLAVPDASSYAIVPYRQATARVFAYMRDDGRPWDGCPRTRLQAMLTRYAEHGLTVKAALEPEFMLFRKTGTGEYIVADDDGMFTVAGLDRHYDLWLEMIEVLAAMGVNVDQHGKEYGHGQYEASTQVTDVLGACDVYLTFRDVVKALAREAGYVASFMPKPYVHLPGCGLHVHLSLWNAEGKKDLTPGVADEEPLSELGRQFVAGLLAHAPGLAGVGAPTVNSYKRLLPGSWAPAHICWGVGNRAALVRIPGMGKRRHVEYRSGDNAANPYIYMAALLSAGLDGIEHQLAAPPAVNQDVGHATETELAASGIGFLPRTLPEALDALAGDAVIADGLGAIVHGEFLKVKRTEMASYDTQVHAWERQVYLEVL